MIDGPWNSLEIVKLLVGVLTPVSVVIFGWLINRRLKKLDHIQWSNQKLIEKRLALYDEVSPLLNKLFCFYTWVGDWKDVSPDDVIDIKRQLDKKINIYRHIFDEVFYVQYQDFIRILFEIYVGPGCDAKIKSYVSGSDGDRVNDSNYDWNDSWKDKFVSSSEVTSKDDIKYQYQRLMNAFRDSIGMEQH